MDDFHSAAEIEKWCLDKAQELNCDLMSPVLIP
jgi:hypothetical protein